MMKLSIIFFSLLGFVVPVYAITSSPIDFNVDLIDLEILQVKVIPVDNDTPDYPLDDADLVKIKLQVTNTGVEYFILKDWMFKMEVIDPKYVDSGITPVNRNYILDNFENTYTEALEIRYEDFFLIEVFEDCEWISDLIQINKSKTYNICFDILRKWHNEVLDINSNKNYFLTFMNNQFMTSCPNCKTILLTTSDPIHKYLTPNWIQNIFEWHKQGIISEAEYQNSIEYLIAKGIISEGILEEKN